jgi:hypothetical protein
MRILIIILASWMLVGCGVPKSSNKTFKHYAFVENIFGKELYVSGHTEFSRAYYHVGTDKFEDLERLRAETLQQCKNEWKNKTFLSFSNLDEGCSADREDDERIYSSKKYKELVAKISSEKIRQDEAAKQFKRDEELKTKREKIARVELLYSSKCKKFKQGSSEYENCLFESEKLALEEQKRLANLPPSERYAYTCEKTYGFRKGTDNFKECVFKIMTTEYEMQNQLNQRRIAELERKVASNQANTTYQNEMLEIERMKAKAMQDQVNFARNKDITDTLLGISSNLLNPPRKPAPNAPQMFNCQTRKFGGFDQIQCF